MIISQSDIADVPLAAYLRDESFYMTGVLLKDWHFSTLNTVYRTRSLILAGTEVVCVTSVYESRESTDDESVFARLVQNHNFISYVPCKIIARQE